MMKGKILNIRRAILILAVLIITLVPFVSSCDSGEVQEVINWAKLWAIVHDITDADGNPNFGAITRFAAGEAFGIGSTGDKEGDAAIDAARILNNIRQAEDEAEQGWDALYKGENIKEGVLPHYNKAVSMRPDDWYYRNERGIAQLENTSITNGAKVAKSDFDEAVALAKKSNKPEEYLRMLKHRAQIMEKIVGHENALHSYSTRDLYLEQSRTYDELYKLTSDHNYLLLKQQADANVPLGSYTVPAN